MWFENQNCAMMGLQATAGKRKLDAVAASGCVASATPPKSPRTCIAPPPPISPLPSPLNSNNSSTKAFVAAVVSSANPSSSNGSTSNTFTSTFSTTSNAFPSSSSSSPSIQSPSSTFTISPNSPFTPPSSFTSSPSFTISSNITSYTSTTSTSFTVSPNSSFTSTSSQQTLFTISPNTSQSQVFTSQPQPFTTTNALTPLRCSTPTISNNSNGNNSTLTSPIINPLTSHSNAIVSPLSPNVVPSSDDCIARLRAVAVPGESGTNHWPNSMVNGNAGLTSSALATTLLSDDLDEDDLDDYDDFSDDDRCAGAPEISYPTTMPRGYRPAQRYPDFQSYQQQRQTGNYYHSTTESDPPNYQIYQNNRTNGVNRGAYWLNTNYYTQSQQTIRCDENGKSYLELGSAIPHPAIQIQTPPIQRPAPPIRCCDGRTRWCSHPCYRQRRLAVLNLSMCKLARYRQCSDPSLHRSVLICNTLRMIEREMEAEGNQMAAFQAQQQVHHQSHPVSHHIEPPTFVGPFGDYANVQNRLTPVITEQSYEQNLRELSASGRATPFPTQGMDTDSGIGDEDTSRTINWSSVLSLTSQTDLDPLNNNELYPSSVEPSVAADVDMSPISAVVESASIDTSSVINVSSMMTTSSSTQLMDEFLPSWNKTSCSVDESLRTEQFNYSSGNNRFPGEGEWDSFMQVLVGGS